MKVQKSGYDRMKRFLDFTVATTGIVLTGPLLGALAVLVLIKVGRPILFRQERPGLNGEIFTLLKFRTMKTPNEKHGLVTDEQRLTPFGNILRSTSLDELPTLWNVVKGDMSIVGPRPLLTKYLPLYSPEQKRRHIVRPGITGLAQVRGRNAISWEAKFSHDIYYVDNRSLALDSQILVETVRTVLRRTGVSADGVATMPEYRGTSD
ncbi:sugar transferase [Pseudarthrobacter sp. SSS035]|uniref:sugar transferase n=1 Tax=Pseudarthrobacter sp. SSS035 TaxID=2931399 RepID=UPI00273A6461|nr:sugar transferase [Pseudarthrobacter sp. SSS035]